ncbi:MAG: DUF2207 domain-containing protein, partial [Enterococcus sp.]|nr:DUF2207 domain-containing protein [Enterococcus sp.]
MKDFKKIYKSILTVMLVISSITFSFSKYIEANAWENYGDGYYLDEGFRTNSFNTYVNVNEDNTYDITETIDVDFTEYGKHGIFRTIPKRRCNISKIAVKGYHFDAYPDGDNMVIQIGNENEIVTGNHTYKITYRITAYEYSKENAKGDKLSLNLLPTKWATDIDYAKMTVKLPKHTDLSDIAIFSGKEGSTENELGIKPYIDRKNDEISMSYANIEMGNGITLDLDLPDGYFVNARNADYLLDWILNGIIILSIIIMLLWIFFGRDKRVIKTVEFYPPDGLTPAEVGFIIDGIANQEEITATIIDLANRGYISIIEEGGDDKSFTLKKLKEIDSSARDFEKTIFYGLFSKGDIATSDFVKNEFGKTAMMALPQIKLTRRVFSLSSQAAQIFSVIIATLSGFIVGGGYYYYDSLILDTALIPGIIGGIIALLSSVLMVRVASIAHKGKRRNS